MVPVVVSYIHTNDDTAATTTADHNVQVVTVSSRTDRTTDASVPVTVTSYICSVQIGESAFTKNKHTVKGSFPKKSETEKEKKRTQRQIPGWTPADGAVFGGESKEFCRTFLYKD